MPGDTSPEPVDVFSILKRCLEEEAEKILQILYRSDC